MNEYILAISVPAFLFLMGIEYLIVRRKKLPYFNFSSSVANICIGMAERLSDLFLAGIFFSVFDYIHKNFALFQIESSIPLYLLLLVITDFVWYWYHRSGHEINLFWATHIVHHQSEDFNYTVSARITMFQSSVRLLFWSVLPLLGFPAEMVTTILIIHGLYPFFVHTRTINKMGFLEKIFITPSHHRVHHASNEKYLDKNYGSVFIIWDKLFGTFEVEKEEPVYGLTSQLNSYSFLWQHFHYFLELWATCKSRKGILQKLKVLFGKPDTISYEVRQELEKKFLPDRMNALSIRPKIKKYIFIQLASAILLLTVLHIIPNDFPFLLKTGFALLLLVTIVNICAILEQRIWIFYLEYIRILIALTLAALVFNNAIVIFGTLFVASAILLYFRTLNKFFISIIYGSFFYYRTALNYRSY